jgi:tol-pal system protein YbgF
MKRTLTTIFAVSATLLTATAAAQSKGERIENLELRMEAIERQIQNQGLLEMSRQIESLTAELRRLRGEFEQVQHELERARAQQRDQYVDLDTRLKAAETALTAAPATGVPGVPGAPGATGSPEADYQAAFNLLKAGKYEEAATALQSFVAAYPQHELASNAQYWLGEAHYVRRNYAEALAAFEGVVQNYPNARKMPDALLKAGYCQLELRRTGPARASLNRLVQQFPDSSAAGEARTRLQRLGPEGG